MEKTVSRLASDLEGALPALEKAVLSQPIDTLSDSKLVIRPIPSKSGRAYQIERFRDTKVFHENLNGESLMKLFRSELDGRYRQALIVTDTETAQYCLKVNGSYKRSVTSSVPRPGGAEKHDREKNYILAEGENIPALVDLGVFSAGLSYRQGKVR